MGSVLFFGVDSFVGKGKEMEIEEKSFEPTYKELKHAALYCLSYNLHRRFEPTYKELKQTFLYGKCERL